MSGYLRRLIANAKRLNGSVHPEVGSIYSSTRAEEPLAISDNEEIVSGRRPERLEMRVQERQPFLLAKDLVASPASSSADMRFSRREEETPASGGPRFFRQGSREERPFQVADEFEKQAPAAPLRNKADAYEPLVEGTEITVSKHASVSSNLSLTANPPKTEAKNVSERSREAERQPDEIQIHIGRIEVTAAPPPVSRPHSRPTRKTLSLDDYLKRGRS